MEYKIGGVNDPKLALKLIFQATKMLRGKYKIYVTTIQVFKKTLF